jgi:hypothetical protein
MLFVSEGSRLSVEIEIGTRTMYEPALWIEDCLKLTGDRSPERKSTV